MTQSVVCGGCGTAVTYGRLSCPECGELLATVAGIGRRSMSTSSTAVATAPMPDAPMPDAPEAGFEATPDDPADDPLDAVMPLELPWEGASASDSELDHGLDGIMAAPMAPDPDPGWDDEELDDDVLATPTGVALEAHAAAVDDDAASLAAAVEPVAQPGVPAWPAALDDAPDEPAWPASPSTFAAAASGAAVGFAPGSYVPPAQAEASVATGSRSTPLAPARTWAGYPSEPVAAAATAPTNGHALASATAAGDPATESAKAPVIDLTQANEFVGWLAIAGSLLATVGFLLPWSNITVIGASGVGYLDRWGLAGPWHVLVVFGVIGMLVAAILRDRVPMWAGIGLPGLGLGALLLGLVWPYLVGPLGGSLGAMAVALGAVMCIAAGIATLVVDRHARLEPSV